MLLVMQTHYKEIQRANLGIFETARTTTGIIKEG